MISTGQTKNSIINDYSRFCGSRSCDARRLNRTPLFDRGIFCLALILGESGDLGRNPGLDSKAKSRVFFACSRTILWRESEGVPDSRSGLIIGDLVVAIGP